MFPFQNSAAIGAGDSTRENPLKQRANLARSKKTMIGLLGRRNITGLDGVARDLGSWRRV
jgi:hypothetical protein